jgi:hypothetical protein
MKKRTLKDHNSWANINIIDLLSILDPSKTNKFLPFLIKHYKNVNNQGKTRSISQYDIESFIKTNSLQNKKEILKNLTDLEFEVLFRVKDLINLDYNVNEVLTEFNEHCNSFLIKNNDITQYNNITEIVEANKKANYQVLKNHKKEKVHVVMENEDWLLIKPLTFESSLKYGSSTKWCTSMRNNPEYFYRYSHRGILIYIINKKTFAKVACFIPLDIEESKHTNTLKLYNESDIESDSYVLNLDKTVMEVLINEYKLKTTNHSFIREKYPEIFKDWTFLNDTEKCEPIMAQEGDPQEAIPLPLESYDDFIDFVE